MEEKKIIEEYNKILKDFENILGNDTTFNTDLQRIAIKKLGSKFSGVYPSDKIPRLNELKSYAIINLDNSSQPGSHWVAVAYDKNTDKLVFYDSFGRSSKKILPSLHAKFGGSILDTEDDAEQKMKEDNCGQRSLAFLSYFDKNGLEKSLKI